MRWCEIAPDERKPISTKDFAMKTAIYCSVLSLVSLWSLTVFGQGSCHNNGGGYPINGGQPEYPYAPADPYYPNPGGQVVTPYIVPQPVATVPVAPQGPKARITVVSVNGTSGSSLASKGRSAKLTVVADEPIAKPQPIEVAVTEPVAEPEINERIAGLVGTWKAVARQGDGELTTVELHLDNRGWAELTVPGSDGQPSTTKSRVNLENEELLLTAADKVVSLGKLVDFNTRQMVLERAEGRMTFVRL
jgi:hypothetical protein